MNNHLVSVTEFVFGCHHEIIQNIDFDYWNIVVNLMCESEEKWVQHDPGGFSTLRFSQTHYAIEDRNESYITNIIKSIEEHVQNKNKVLVHCRHGIDRTSFILGMILARESYLKNNWKPRPQTIINHMKTAFHPESFRNQKYTQSFESMLKSILLFEHA